MNPGATITAIQFLEQNPILLWIIWGLNGLLLIGTLLEEIPELIAMHRYNKLMRRARNYLKELDAQRPE